jgi:DNA-binding response OmpR family regulator
MASQVVIFDYGEPRQKLLAWFLSDSGVHNFHVTALADALSILKDQRPSVVVINSAEPNERIAHVARALRDAHPETRIIVMHEGKHQRGELEVLADLCIHDVRDVDGLVKIITAALDNEIPDKEPHAAADDVTRD